MKKLTLFVAALMLTGATFAQEKACCKKKGGKCTKEEAACCKKKGGAKEGEKEAPKKDAPKETK